MKINRAHQTAICLLLAALVLSVSFTALFVHPAQAKGIDVSKSYSSSGYSFRASYHSWYGWIDLMSGKIALTILKNKSAMTQLVSRFQQFAEKSHLSLSKARIKSEIPRLLQKNAKNFQRAPNKPVTLTIS